MAEMLCPAVFQEALSRGLSFWLGKREEKASQGHLMERLEVAVSQLEFALERSQELRIRHPSLISRREQIKSAYIEAMELLDKHKQQQAVPAEQELQDALGVKKRKLWDIRAKNWLTTSSFAGLSTDGVRRFEWYADYAGKFVRDVESGCSLYHYTFCNPIVRHLLEGKTLRYDLRQGNMARALFIWPTYSDERGVEATLGYRYEDSTMDEKYFLLLSLRLSESTDIVGVASKCLQFLTPAFKLAAECAIGELTLLLSNLQGIAHSYGPLPVGIQDSAIKLVQFARPDPACCKGSRHGLCAKDDVSSALADIFPEQVIYFTFRCNIPALESSTRSSFEEVNRGWKPPLEVLIHFHPHVSDLPIYSPDHIGVLIESYIDSFVTGMIKNLKFICAVETIGNDVENEKCIKDVSIQEVAETIKSNAINCFSRQPELRDYKIDWHSEHGAATFIVKNASMEAAGVPRTRKRYNTRARTRRSSRR